MARGKTLIELLDTLRAETGLSMNPSLNSQVRDSHVVMLQREQEALYDEFDWPHLRVERTLAVQEGERFYDPPSDMNIDRIGHIEFRYGLEWLRLAYGIGPAQYAMWNSELDVRSWPVARWRMWEGQKIELWPIPSSGQDTATLDGTLKFVGIKNLAPLVKDSDRADLDDMLVVLPVAIKLLARGKKADVQLQVSSLQRRYMKLKARLSKRDSFGLFQGDRSDRKPLRGPPRVQYRITGS